MRIVTTSEQLSFDILQELKRTNELLEKLIPAVPVVEEKIPATPAKTSTTPAPVPAPHKRGR